MASSKELNGIVLQYLEEEKYSDSLHRFESETGSFFNFKYFSEKLLAGQFQEIDDYSRGFRKVNLDMSNLLSFEIRKLKYMECLDRKENVKAFQIYMEDLVEFPQSKDLRNLLFVKNIRECPEYVDYDAQTERTRRLAAILFQLRNNPTFGELLTPGNLPPERSLRVLCQQQSTSGQQQSGPAIYNQSGNPSVSGTGMTSYRPLAPGFIRPSSLLAPFYENPQHQGGPRQQITWQVQPYCDPYQQQHLFQMQQQPQQQAVQRQQGAGTSSQQQHLGMGMSIHDYLKSPEGIQALLRDQNKLIQLLEQHPDLLQILQEKLHQP